MVNMTMIVMLMLSIAPRLMSAVEVMVLLIMILLVRIIMLMVTILDKPLTGMRTESASSSK